MLNSNNRMKSLPQIAKEIAKSLSFEQKGRVAYKLIAQNGLSAIVGFSVEPNGFIGSEFSIRYFVQPSYILFE